MNWGTILPGISALLATLTGLQRFERDSPPKVTDSKLKAKLEFAVIACKGLGLDERIYTYDGDVVDPNARMVLTLRGYREFTLGIKCTSYDHGYTKSAEWHLERVYSRLSWPSSQKALNALGVAWVGAGSFQNLSGVMAPEDRVFSLGQKDFFFTAAVEETDAPDASDSPIGTIDHAILTSVYLYDEAGQALESQIGPVTVPPIPEPEPPPEDP